MTDKPLKKPDKDIAWALQVLEDEADLSSEINGSDDGDAQNQRRLETVFKRLAREAGYDTA